VFQQCNLLALSGLRVLDGQRQQFAVERELAASNAVVLRSRVALYKALSG
jgi:outer membrane protein TolC